MPVAAPPAPAAAPVAPAAKPAPAPAPAKPAAAAPPAPSRTGERSNFFEDEDRIPDAVESEPAKPTVKAGAAPASVDDAPAGTDELDKAALGDKPAPATPGPPKPADALPEPRTNRELKRVYEANKKALKLAEARSAELEARVAELDGIATTAKKDTGPLAEQLAAAQKRIDEYEGRLRLKAYEESDDFKSKHLAPFKKAEARAFQDVRQLEYTEGIDEDTQQPKVRAATDADFIELYNLPVGKAYAFAKRVFGDSSQLVMNHYHSLHNAQDGMREAIAEYRTRGAEEEQQTQARTAQEREAADRMWRTANQDLQAKHFKELGIDPDDAETKDLLGKAYGTVDKLFSGNGSLTMAEKVGLQASVRQRAALFGVQGRQLRKLQADYAEAQKTIEELRGSAPGKPKPKGDAAPVGEFKDLADDMAKYPMES